MTQKSLEEEEIINIYELWVVLLKHWLVVVICGLIAAAVGFALVSRSNGFVGINQISLPAVILQNDIEANEFEMEPVKMLSVSLVQNLRELYSFYNSSGGVRRKFFAYNLNLTADEMNAINNFVIHLPSAGPIKSVGIEIGVYNTEVIQTVFQKILVYLNKSVNERREIILENKKLILERYASDIARLDKANVISLSDRNSAAYSSYLKMQQSEADAKSSVVILNKPVDFSYLVNVSNHNYEKVSSSFVRPVLLSFFGGVTIGILLSFLIEWFSKSKRLYLARVQTVK